METLNLRALLLIIRLKTQQLRFKVSPNLKLGLR